MFELKLTSTEIQDGSCQVSWCLDEETLKYLADEKVTNPQVVLVVAPQDNYLSSKEYRKVVDLKDLVTYLEFRRPKTNKIFAFISQMDKGNCRDRYLTRKNGEYISDILNYSGSDYNRFLSSKLGSSGPISDEESYKLLFSEPQSVMVPKEVFAEEPAEWVKTWANHFFRNKPIDQCDFRRRKIFAFTVQPMLMFLNISVRFTALFLACLVGSRATSLQPLLHPLSYDLEDALNVFSDVYIDGSIFIRELNKKDIPETFTQFISWLVRKFYLLPFMPIIMIAWGTVLWFHLWHLALTVGLVALAVIAVMAIIIFIVTGGAKETFWSVVNYFSTLNQNNDLWYLEQEEMDLLTCNSNKKAMTFQNLPSKKKTLYLRYQNLKSKLCKPFSA